MKNASLVRKELLLDSMEYARRVIHSGFLTDEKAVEISMFSFGQIKVQRVIRLAVYDTAFGMISDADAGEVLLNQYEGVLCQWPMESQTR